MVVFHTTLCHVPVPELALTEASRILVGRLARRLRRRLRDDDVRCGDFDPLQACVEACVDYLVHDRWLIRRLPKLVCAAGFELGRFRSYSYMEAPSSDGYMFAIVDRGADALLASGRITLEARTRSRPRLVAWSDAGEFFGHIAYAAVFGRRR